MAPYEDWQAGGRVMVQVRPIARAMECTWVTWNAQKQMARVSDSMNCGPTADVFVNLYPGSRRVEVYDGSNPIAPFIPYELDVATTARNGHLMASARILADAFKCYSWWQDSDRSFRIDCGRKNQLHENLEQVMASNPPELDPGTNLFVPPLGPDGYRMYPKTLEAYELIIGMSNAIPAAAQRDTVKDMRVAYEETNGRVRIYSSKNPGRVYGFQYGAYTTFRLDAREQLIFENKLIAAKARNMVYASAGTLLLSVFIPELGLSKGVDAVAEGIRALLGGTAAGYVKETQIQAYKTCVQVARLDAKRWLGDADEAVVTVAMKWPVNIRCIPADTGHDVLTWRDFEMRGL